jgi:hypothetical protein
MRDVLAHRPRPVDAMDVLHLQQLHAVEVHDEVQAGDRVRVGAGALLLVGLALFAEGEEG